MSHFYAGIQGHRGAATRQGTAKSGISGHIRGWGVGVRVICFVDENGEDCIRVYATGGSRGFQQEIKIAQFTEANFNNPRFSSVVTNVTK